MPSRMRSRKFTLAVGLSIIYCLLLVFGKIDQAGFIALIQWTLAGYLGANVGHRAVEVFSPQQGGAKDVS